MKKYERSHPWIDFSIDMRRASHVVWLLLGAAQSKCKHIAGALLDPETAIEMHRLYLAKGVLATTAIEGNTLTEEQVRDHLEGKLELPKSKEYLRQEIDNIVAACNDIADSHFDGMCPDLCVEDIKNYNKRVLEGLPLEDSVVSGELRKINVTVGRYLGAPVEDLLYLLEKLCLMLNDEKFTLGDRWPFASGVLKAIIAHLYIAWIHPFGDGNGRTARLVEFKLCISSGIPAPAVHLLSNHYNETRSAYYRALDETSKTKDPFKFIAYALEGYVDQLEEQIKKIRQVQYKTFWTNYIYTVFKGLDMDGIPNKRRRHLVLDLSEHAFPENEWIDVSSIDTLSTRVMRDYLNVTSKTKSRDILELQKLKLIEKKGNKIRPNTDLISAYLPRQILK